MILNDSQDSFFARMVACAGLAVTFVEGRQITQEDDFTISTITGTMSLGAYILLLAQANYQRQEIFVNPRVLGINLKRASTLLFLLGALIKISYLRAQFINPTEYLDRDHPDVWNYIYHCGTLITVSALLE